MAHWKSQPHAIFCGRHAKNRNRKQQPQIAVANRTHESIIIEIERLQKIAKRKSLSQIANRVHVSLGLGSHRPLSLHNGAPLGHYLYNNQPIENHKVQIVLVVSDLFADTHAVTLYICVKGMNNLWISGISTHNVECLLCTFPEEGF